MKILVDMNLSPDFVSFLRAEGFDAIHWSSLGKATAPDEEIMAYAGRNDFAVLTHDRDFGVMAVASRGQKPSIVQLRCPDVMAAAIWRQMVVALHETELLIELGAIVTIGTHKVRVRVLPFPPVE